MGDGMERIYYIYEWYFVDTGKVFYVGKGKGRRYREKKDRNDKFIKYVNKYECKVRKTHENLREDEAFKKEIEMIAYYKNIGQCSCNMTIGGDAPPTHFGIDAPNRREVVQLTLNGQYVKTWDYIHEIEKELGISNSAIVACCKGKHGRCSTGGFLWIYKDVYDPKKQYTYNPKTNAKPILQYRLDGSFVREWNSAKQINVELGFKRSGICGCLKGRYKTCNGFIWKYKESETIDLLIPVDENLQNKVPTPIVQLGLDELYISTFKDAVEASIAVSGTWRNNSSILHCCKGTRITACGYKWMYEYEYLKLKSSL